MLFFMFLCSCSCWSKPGPISTWFKWPFISSGHNHLLLFELKNLSGKRTVPSKTRQFPLVALGGWDAYRYTPGRIFIPMVCFDMQHFAQTYRFPISSCARQETNWQCNPNRTLDYFKLKVWKSCKKRASTWKFDVWYEVKSLIGLLMFCAFNTRIAKVFAWKFNPNQLPLQITSSSKWLPMLLHLF